MIERLSVPPGRVIAVPLRIADRFSPDQADRERLPERFRIRARYVLSVGTREPRKT